MKHQARVLFAPLLTALAFAAQAAPGSLPGADQIVSRTLPNGLKIVVWPDHDIPNVAMYTWYRAGSRNEEADSLTVLASGDGGPGLALAASRRRAAIPPNASKTARCAALTVSSAWS